MKTTHLLHLRVESAIAEVTPINNYTLYIVSEEGNTGVFDVGPYLELEAFADLKNHDEFKKVMNGKYFVEWDCGADLSGPIRLKLT